ncbi:hypothetical protein NLG97_g9451 [Lecanicillium saksenae]|uniref:Uncharacterized protein n=1 Tax=Lecanicillium saksenae TaxID=468837 RepID=A0ACC1QHG4_9HYPO|nr:hypothetical protein NLG97_g9451 [Lecanicillium saksenae]
MSPFFSYELVCRLSLGFEFRVDYRTPQFQEQQSSLGALRKLPRDIFLTIFDNLDMKSLLHLSMACGATGNMVHGYPPYRHLLLSAQYLLSQLRAARLHRFYNANYIYQRIIRSDRCVACEQFGVYAYLPTYERVCLRCLTEESLLKMVDAVDAMTKFDIDFERLLELPQFYNKYTDKYLLSLKSFVDADNIPLGALLKIKQLLASGDTRALVTSLYSYEHVPYLSNTGPDSGSFCLGCIPGDWLQGTDLFHGATSQVPPNQASELSHTLLSRSELVVHLEICPGVQKLLKEWGIVPNTETSESVPVPK